MLTQKISYTPNKGSRFLSSVRGLNVQRHLSFLADDSQFCRPVTPLACGLRCNSSCALLISSGVLKRTTEKSLRPVVKDTSLRVFVPHTSEASRTDFGESHNNRSDEAQCFTVLLSARMSNRSSACCPPPLKQHGLISYVSQSDCTRASCVPLGSTAKLIQSQSPTGIHPGSAPYWFSKPELLFQRAISSSRTFSLEDRNTDGLYSFCINWCSTT